MDVWEMYSWALTGVGLGLKIRKAVANPERQRCYELADLLRLLREIALQAGCLMPMVAVIEDADTVNELRRNQQYLKGRIMLIDGKRPGPDDLLKREADDIRIQPPRRLGMNEFCRESKGIVGQEVWEKYLADMPVVDEQDPGKRLEAWEKAWENRLRHHESAPSVRSGKADTSRKDGVDGTEETGFAPYRLQRAKINNFKGIKELDINLDADIILVSGANGNGKSSFIEALALGLTGYHPEIDDGDNQKAPGHFFHRGADKYHIKLSMLPVEGENRSQKQVTCTGEKGKFHCRPLHLIRKKSEPVGNQWENVSKKLHYRLTSFLPEHVSLLFDSIKAPRPAVVEEADPEETPSCRRCPADPETIADLFPTLPMEAEALCMAINKIRNEQREKEEKLQEIDSALHELVAQWTDKAASFFPDLQKCVEPFAKAVERTGCTSVAAWRTPPTTPEDFHNALEQQKDNMGLLRSDSADPWDEGNLQALLKGAHKQALPDSSSRKLLELDRELTKLEEKLRRLEQVADGVAGDVFEPLMEIFSRLKDKEFLRKNIEVLEEYGLKTIADELELVQPDRAGSCFEELKNQTGISQGKITKRIEDTRKDIADKKKEYQRVEREQQGAGYQAYRRVNKFLEDGQNREVLSGLKHFQELWRERENKKQEIRNIDAAALEKLQDAVNKLRGDPDKFRGALEKSLRHVLRRFVLTDGMEQMELREADGRFTLVADSNREKQQGTGVDHDEQRDPRCFSSGQKVQAALAWLVACRELIQSKKNRDKVRFPHRIMIMDDPTATFDLNNLQSQALLWRQLAYAGDGDNRWQLIISSHHEEFTARLLDLLCPPGNGDGLSNGEPHGTMKLIRFQDWTPDKGPKIKCFSVKPQPESLAQAKKLFQLGLESLGRQP